MKRILIVIVLISVSVFCFSAFADEEYKGKFEVVGTTLIINKYKSISLHHRVEVLSSTGREIPIESLKYARVIKVVRDSANNVKKIIVLGWWD